MDSIITWASGLLTGKLAWVKILLGVLAGVATAFAPLQENGIIPPKYQAIAATVVGVGTWLTAHGFHQAPPPDQHL